MSRASPRRDAESGAESPEPTGARSTARPPDAARGDEGAALDLAAAVRAARDGTGRDAAPAATAKIPPFRLAEALARLSADADPPSSGATRRAAPEPASVSVPTPAVDITREDLLAVGAGRATLPPTAASAAPDAPATSAAGERRDATPPIGVTPGARRADAPAGDDAPRPRGGARGRRRPFEPLVLVPLALGVAALVYAYVVANR